MSELLHDGYFTFRRESRDGQRFDMMSGPGHDVVIVVGVQRGPDGLPRFILKTGDTRPARVLAGRPFVKDGLVGGRMDDPGADVDAIARAEVEEEIGGRVLGSLHALGGLPTPSMPSLSTEADHYRLAFVDFPESARPTGDGGGMEVPEMLGAKGLTRSELLEALHSGAVGEVCRARVAYARAAEKLGLHGNRTRGLGEIVALPEQAANPPPPVPSPSVDSAALEVLETVALSQGRHVVARVSHTSAGEAVGAAYTVEVHVAVNEEVELLVWGLDPERRAVVCLERVRPPVLRAKAERLGQDDSTRSLWQGANDICALGQSKEAAWTLAEASGGREPRLLLAGEASPGQSTLVESIWEVRCHQVGQDWPTLDEAIERCRVEGASARTEAGLLELEARLSARGHTPSANGLS